MQTDCTHIPYQLTGYYSKIVTDYLEANPAIRPFYAHEVSIAGIQAAINTRQAFSNNRELLVSELDKQYNGVEASQKLKENIQLLLQPNTFTITTAHQPNIFTGPIYFVYKILHVIKLAEYLRQELPAYNFVPVYYMGSEDADLDELGSITVNGQKYTWQTKQTGAVGRMKADKNFTALMHQLHGQLGVEPYGGELMELFRQCYREGNTIQQATLELVNALFSEYGLVVVIPDNAGLKRSFNPVVEKELKEGFSHKAVTETLGELEKHYKAQAGGRELNLFYLIENKRERIERDGAKWMVKTLGLEWDEEGVLKELDEHPERFSANVILRGVFQETILPNIAFIGGGGELAYWLELKKVFEAAQVPYPVLLLRNSFLVMDERQSKKIKGLGFSDADLFKDGHALLNMIVERKSENKYELNGELSSIENAYEEIKALAGKIDVTLKGHVEALRTRAVKRLHDLEKKLKSAERRKFATESEQIQKLKLALFPNNNLQERVENISGFYAKHGKQIIQVLLDNSLGLEQQFAVLRLLEE